MKAWFKDYQKLIYKSRGISLVGASLMFLAVGLEIARTLQSLSWSEAPLSEELFWQVAQRILLMALVGISVLPRVVLLTVSKSKSYRKFFLTWILSAGSIVLYVWINAPAFLDASYGGEGGISFTIYDMSRPDLVESFGLWFVIAGILRSLLTAGFAAVKQRYK